MPTVSAVLVHFRLFLKEQWMLCSMYVIVMALRLVKTTFVACGFEGLEESAKIFYLGVV